MNSAHPYRGSTNSKGARANTKILRTVAKPIDLKRLERLLGPKAQAKR